MKNLNKKILTACLALMVAVAMAVPTFAAELIPENSAGNNLCANVYGNSEVSDNRNVMLYTRLGSRDQRWYMQTDSSGYEVMVTSLHPDYALNINHSNNNCDIFRYAGNFYNGKSDSGVYWYNGYLILTDWQYSMAYQSLTSGGNIYWANGRLHQWTFQ